MGCHSESSFIIGQLDWISWDPVEVHSSFAASSVAAVVQSKHVGLHHYEFKSKTCMDILRIWLTFSLHDPFQLTQIKIPQWHPFHSTQYAPSRTEMCTFPFWMGNGTSALWDLWDWPVSALLQSPLFTITKLGTHSLDNCTWIRTIRSYPRKKRSHSPLPNGNNCRC